MYLKEAIVAKVDIVDVVGEQVLLKRRGNTYWGLCPFHEEKTPSFSVSREKQMFYCFGCNTGGDVFKFVMLRDHVNFPQAIERLAATYGISMTDDVKTVDYKHHQGLRQVREHETLREKKLEKWIEDEYNHWVNIEQWINVILKHVYCERDLDRPAVIWALNNRDKIEAWLNEFNKGTDEDRLDLFVTARRWNTWEGM